LLFFSPSSLNAEEEEEDDARILLARLVPETVIRILKPSSSFPIFGCVEFNDANKEEREERVSSSSLLLLLRNDTNGAKSLVLVSGILVVALVVVVVDVDVNIIVACVSLRVF
jgi:hypothetical protein